ncbi:vitamin K epoxide reductase family protein [Falsiroseomonas sp.]|uniref:vitamin K epoxide reductase family protein n=1 Tax=Falsiroseomonas sp. TaxID=2870721 RepID=UPI0035679593
MPAPITRLMGSTPARLRRDFRHDDSALMQLRRGTAAVSLLGIGMMAATTLLQIGAVRRLPDPPIRGFDTTRVNTSDEAYSYGGPDSPINILAHATNLVLATTGGADRMRRHPWLPLLAVAVEAPQAAVAAKYLFHQMPKVDRAWCPYCIVDALAHFATLALVLPEAFGSLRHLLARGRRTG